MQAQTPRKESTMARRILDTYLPSSQKAQNRHSPPTRIQTSYPHRSHNPLCSTCPHRSLLSLRSSFSPTNALLPAQPHASAPHSEMPIIIIRNWLTENGLQGFILVAEAPPYPNATEIASRINIETITDLMLRKKLNLDCTGERQIEMVPSHILERYYGKYSLSAKAFRTKDIPDPFFRDVALRSNANIR